VPTGSRRAALNTTPPWKSCPVAVIAVVPTPGMINTTDGSQPEESVYRTENVIVVLVVPEPGLAVPAVSVVWRFAFPPQLAASAGAALRPRPSVARMTARAKAGPPPRTPIRSTRR
jgi:hypothetical protein